jgi:acetyl-CoA carboxylase biotin carboxyl carrier protein
MESDRERIDDLVAIMREHGLDALRLTDGDLTYDLVAREPQRSDGEAPGFAPEVVLTAGAGMPVAGPTIKRVTAPIIGVFYLAPSPGAEPFVAVGDRVAVGQVLCILEAMKLMNEITSDDAGVVTRVLPENGQIVALGEEMFWIEP